MFSIISGSKLHFEKNSDFCVCLYIGAIFGSCWKWKIFFWNNKINIFSNGFQLAIQIENMLISVIHIIRTHQGWMDASTNGVSQSSDSSSDRTERHRLFYIPIPENMHFQIALICKKLREKSPDRTVRQKSEIGVTCRGQYCPFHCILVREPLEITDSYLTVPTGD